MRKETYWCDCDDCGSVLDDGNPRYIFNVKEANGKAVYRDLCGDCYHRIMRQYFPDQKDSSDERPTL